MELCYEAKNWKALNENIVALSKRRSQIKKAITDMVRKCCEFVDSIADREQQLILIDTLRTVTAGKVSLLKIF